MGDKNKTDIERLQSVLTALLKHQLDEALSELAETVEGWQSGELGPFEAHAEVLSYAGRTETLANRVAAVDPDNPGSVLRDAFDAGLVTREEFVELMGKDPLEVEPSPEVGGETSAQLPDKREFVSDLLEEGAVLLHIDARRDDVSVPEGHRRDPNLVLRFGYGLSPSIVDLTIDDSGISGTLTFRGVPHRCVLPWSAVYVAVSEASERVMVWPDDVPPAALDEITGTTKPGAGLSSVPHSPGGTDSTAVKKSSKRPRAGHLKLVE